MRVLIMLLTVLRMLLAVLVMLLTVLRMLLAVLIMLFRVLRMLLASGAGNALREASSSVVALRSLLHVGVCLQAACHIISSFKPHGAYFEFSRSRLLCPTLKSGCHTVRRWNGLKLAVG
jgi:hypothetical protein